MHLSWPISEDHHSHMLRKLSTGSPRMSWVDESELMSTSQTSTAELLQRLTFGKAF